MQAILHSTIMDKKKRILRFLVVMIAITLPEHVTAIKATSMSMSSSKLPPMYKSLASKTNSSGGDTGESTGTEVYAANSSPKSVGAAGSGGSRTDKSPEPNRDPTSTKFEKEYASMMSHDREQAKAGNKEYDFSGYEDRHPTPRPRQSQNPRDFHSQYENHPEMPWDKTTLNDWEGNHVLSPTSGVPDRINPFHGSKGNLIETNLVDSAHLRKSNKSLMDRYKEFHRGVDNGSKIKMQKENVGKYGIHESKDKKSPAPHIKSIYDAVAPLKFKKNNEIGLDEFIRNKFNKTKAGKKNRKSSNDFGFGKRVPLNKPHKFKSSPFDATIQNHKTLTTKHTMRNSTHKGEKLPQSMVQFRQTMMEKHKFKHHLENLVRNPHGHNVFGGKGRNNTLAASSLVKLGERDRKSLVAKKQELLSRVKNRGLQNSKQRGLGFQDALPDRGKDDGFGGRAPKLSSI